MKKIYLEVYVMNDKIVAEAINTSTRNDLRWYYRELILLYDDGTWEKIFRSSSRCDITCIAGNRLRRMTRSQVIAKINDLVRDGKLIGEFLV